MKISQETERTVIDNVKFGALAVLNKALEKTIVAGTDPKCWSAEDKMKYLLILDVRDEILRRVRQTFSKPKRASRKNENAPQEAGLQSRRNTPRGGG
jgi:hypothetical protein